MKRFLSSILLYVFCASTFAQITIPLQKEDGVYKLSCEVNGARMKMILDTGASYVSLSMGMARYLYENDYITDDDIKGVGKSRIATGEIVDNIKVNLREVKIGTLKVKDIDAVILEQQETPLLFGLSAIKAMGAVTISGDNLIINNAETELTDEEQSILYDLCDEMRDRADEYYDEEKYHVASTMYQRIKDECGLETCDYVYLIESLYRIGEYEKALTMTAEWENSEDTASTLKACSDIYRFASLSAIDLKYYSKAVDLLKKEIVIDELLGWSNCTSYASLGYAYYYINNIPMSQFYFRKAINSLLKDGNVTLKNVINGKPKIADFIMYGTTCLEKDFYDCLGRCFFTYAILIYTENDYRETPEYHYLLKSAAKCGYNDAIAECKERKIIISSFLYDSKFDYLFY